MSFDWQGFINGDFIVRCNTKEKAIDFFKKSSRQGSLWCDENWEKDKEDTCYFCIGEGVYRTNTKFFEDSKKDILEWEIEFKGVDNMLKELTFKEVIANIKEGEIYTLVQDNYRVKKIFMKNNIIEIESNDDPIRVGEIERYIKEQKPVSFMDAMKAYEEGKIITCKIKTKDFGTLCYEYERTDDCCVVGYAIKNQHKEPIKTREILEGEWYIE